MKSLRNLCKWIESRNPYQSHALRSKGPEVTQSTSIPKQQDCVTEENSPGVGRGVLDQCLGWGAAEGTNTWPCLGQKRPEIPSLSGISPSFFLLCLGQTTVNDDNRATLPCLGQIQTLFGQIYLTLYTLFRAEEAKNHTLSSGMSLKRSHKGVPPGKHLITISKLKLKFKNMFFFQLL